MDTELCLFFLWIFFSLPAYEPGVKESGLIEPGLRVFLHHQQLLYPPKMEKTMFEPKMGIFDPPPNLDYIFGSDRLAHIRYNLRRNYFHRDVFYVFLKFAKANSPLKLAFSLLQKRL